MPQLAVAALGAAVGSELAAGTAFAAFGGQVGFFAGAAIGSIVFEAPTRQDESTNTQSVEPT
jgi:hypothetical protein